MKKLLLVLILTSTLTSCAYFVVKSTTSPEGVTESYGKGVAIFWAELNEDVFITSQRWDSVTEDGYPVIGAMESGGKGIGVKADMDLGALIQLLTILQGGSVRPETLFIRR